MQPITLEYIAGFVDGEGTFTISKAGRDLYQPRFVITNTDKQILDDIRRYFSISEKLRTRKRTNTNWKACYRLEERKIDFCKSIATLLEPYLRIKKAQAQIIMQFPRSHQPYSGSRLKEDFSTRAYILKLRKRIMLLNKRGPTNQGANEDLQPEPDPQLNLLDLKQREVIKA